MYVGPELVFIDPLPKVYVLCTCENVDNYRYPFNNIINSYKLAK